MDRRTAFWRLLLGGAALLLCAPVIAHADSYQVTAQIPYDIPPAAATIDGPSDETTTDSPTQTISGTCVVMSPSAIVSIWRNGQTIGSSVCQLAGTFSVVVHLNSGLNELLPRTSNISDIYGPDGVPIHITYQPPPTPSLPSSNPSTTSGGTSSSTKPPEVASDLSITSIKPFGVLSEKDNAVTVQIVVNGSATPFDITVNWGDGSTDRKSVAGAGTYDFTHTYDKAAVYIVRATVTDVLGASTIYSFPVVPSSVGVIDKTVDRHTVKTSLTAAKILPYIAGGSIILILTGLVFRAGEGYTLAHNLSKTKGRSKAARKKTVKGKKNVRKS